MTTTEIVLASCGVLFALAGVICLFGGLFLGWSWMPSAYLYGAAYTCRWFATKRYVEASLAEAETGPQERLP